MMAHKGEFKPPVLPIKEAVERALEMIDAANGDPVALFMVAGEIISSKKSSAAYKARMKALAGNLIGVFDDGVNHLALRQDLEEFYKETA